MSDTGKKIKSDGPQLENHAPVPGADAPSTLENHAPAPGATAPSTQENHAPADSAQ